MAVLWSNIRTIALALSVLLAVSAAAPAKAQPQQPVLIRNVTVIDVEAGRHLPGRTVLVRNGLIESITSGVETVVLPADARVLDGAGRYLIPGLFDAHVHYVDPDSFGRLLVANGVTFVRELGNATENIIAVRDRLNRAELLGPRMICTGAIIDGNPPVWPFSEACETEEEARAAVRKLHAAGVDQIKVYSRLKPEVYLAAVAEAHKLGLKAVGHIPNALGVEDARAAGQNSVEHFSRFETLLEALLPPEGGRRTGFAMLRIWPRVEQIEPQKLLAALKPLADSGMVQCPTLVVMEGVGGVADPEASKNPLLAYVPIELRGFWQGDQYTAFAQFAPMLVGAMGKMVKAMHDAGVPLIVGTDLANPYIFAGFSVHREMELWADAGVPAAAILRAATLTPAQFCGVGDRYGAVAEGMAASLVLLDADPLADIRSVAKIHAVLLDGRVFDRPALDALLDETKKVVAAGLTDTTAEVRLDLPGEVVLRGTYRSKFQQFDAGQEDFLITRTPDGHHVMSHVQPKGGFEKPHVVSLHAGADFAVRSVSMQQLTKDPLKVTYTARNGAIEATGVQGVADPAQVLEIPEDGLFGVSSTASDYLFFRQLALNPGDRREITLISYGFGQPAWRLSTTPMSVQRHDDAALQRPGGRSVTARRYTSEITTPMGVFKGESWTDDRGVILKAVLTMPFGVVTTELQE